MALISSFEFFFFFFFSGEFAPLLFKKKKSIAIVQCGYELNECCNLCL